MRPATLIDSEQLNLIVKRLCYQLIENHGDFSNSVILGIQPRGVQLAQRLKDTLEAILKGSSVNCGTLDITFHRDDFRRRDEPINPSSTDIDFEIEDKKVVLIDDVLYTGRTIRASLDALMNFGRPTDVELLVLIDRRFSREIPIEPNYIGKSVDSYDNQRVEVNLEEKNKVLLLTTKRAE